MLCGRLLVVHGWELCGLVWCKAACRSLLLLLGDVPQSWLPLQTPFLLAGPLPEPAMEVIGYVV